MGDHSIVLEALKWIVLVFLAGFVGYFGKYLGIKIISRFHKDEAAKAGSSKKSGAETLDGQTVEKPPVSGHSGTQSAEDSVPVAMDSLTGHAGEKEDALSKKQKKERLKQAKKRNKAEIKRQKETS